MNQYDAMTAWELEAERRREILARRPRLTVEEATSPREGSWLAALMAPIRRVADRTAERRAPIGAASPRARA